jgi:predicted DsbA family dithiol-disulfide isomerase
MKNETSQVLRIDMVSDIVCPWCIIGYKKLEKALAELKKTRPELSVELHFQPFQLMPQIPPEGKGVKAHITDKYGTSEAALQAAAVYHERIKEVAREHGVELNAGPESRVYNTFEAHKLLHAAENPEQQLALKLALFKAYFTDQKNISDRETLVGIASEAGVEEGRARRILEDDAVAKGLAGDIYKYIEMGVSSVPTFFVNERFSTNGAQDEGVLRRFIEDILDGRSEPQG